MLKYMYIVYLNELISLAYKQPIETVEARGIFCVIFFSFHSAACVAVPGSKGNKKKNNNK